MIHVIVVCEGQTEETFVRDVLTPPLAERQIFPQPRLVPTSKYGRGGALKRDRVLRYLRNTLRERQDTYVTTFFDLYGLSGDFPGHSEASVVVDPVERARMIETHFAEAVVQTEESRPDRFLPHIQPFEFEALLFADVERLTEVEVAWKAYTDPLRTVRKSFPSPEHINDGIDTRPSARLGRLLVGPRYQKVLHGAAAAARMGLGRIRAECRHFGAWLTRIEGLRPL